MKPTFKKKKKKKSFYGLSYPNTKYRLALVKFNLFKNHTQNSIISPTNGPLAIFLKCTILIDKVVSVTQLNFTFKENLNDKQNLRKVPLQENTHQRQKPNA